MKYNDLRGDYKELITSYDQSEELRTVYKGVTEKQ
jgi:hypothetical protein